MGGYKPINIAGYETGLVQEREEFLLPADAYPTLENAFVWRERIKRKQGCQLLGRLRRKIGTTDAAGNQVVVITPNPIATGISSFKIGNNTFTDPGGASPVALLTNGPGTATLDRATGTLTVLASTALTDIFYYPGLPVMGLCLEELNNINSERTIAFDRYSAYKFTGSPPSGNWEEFIPGTTWSGTDSEFFWSTNYWVTPAPGNSKLFWVTNYSVTGDPIRYTDSSVWIDFTPIINALGARLLQCLAILPFRGRLVVFNTFEEITPGTSATYTNRIRWAAIGNPISDISALFPLLANTNPNAWRDDIRGQGGFLDIPTSEAIVSVGFVRDNCVIYCERSTWQLRYTGRSIAPFQIERVNSELGAESTFSAVQFDTSLVGIGDKGIVECDSFKSERIDIKIPDLVFQFNNNNSGPQRVHGIRDFQQRLAYWIYPNKATTLNNESSNAVFPDRRLVYNYENDSWAIFTDSLTCLGTIQLTVSRTWASIPYPWAKQNYSWISRPSLFPSIIGGNQQGFVQLLDQQVTNDVSLSVQNITGNTTTPTRIYSPNHNLQTGQIIAISNIPAGTGYAKSLNNPKTGTITAATQADPCQITSASHTLSTGNIITISGVVGMTELNGNTYTITVVDANTFTLDGVNSTSFSVYVSGGTWSHINVFFVKRIDADNFDLQVYSPISQEFSLPQLDAPATYVGGGLISVIDNFRIKSKKFNHMDEGQKIQMGYVDVLMDSTSSGAISLKVYVDYDDTEPTNIPPENPSDTVFNSIVPTTVSDLYFGGSTGKNTTKTWHRVFCATRGDFLTIEWTLSNSQMNGIEQQSDVQIDAQILWERMAGRIGI